MDTDGIPNDGWGAIAANMGGLLVRVVLSVTTPVPVVMAELLEVPAGCGAIGGGGGIEEEEEPTDTLLLLDAATADWELALLTRDDVDPPGRICC